MTSPEFGGMRRREVKSRFPARYGSGISDGAVRVGKVSVIAVQPVDRTADHGIVAAESLQFITQGIRLTAAEPQHTFEIARRSDVHRIGRRPHRRPRTVLAAAQELGHHVVPVRSRDESAEGEPHAAGEHPGREVSVVTARHHDHRPSAARLLPPQAIAVEIIECLRYPAQQVDRIGRRHAVPRTEFCVGKQPLTSRWQSSNVPATRSGWILPPSVVIWHSCSRLIFPSG